MFDVDKLVAEFYEALCADAPELSRRRDVMIGMIAVATMQLTMPPDVIGLIVGKLLKRVKADFDRGAN